MIVNPRPTLPVNHYRKQTKLSISSTVDVVPKLEQLLTAFKGFGSLNLLLKSHVYSQGEQVPHYVIVEFNISCFLFCVLAGVIAMVEF